MITTCGKSGQKKSNCGNVLGVSQGDISVIEAYLQTLAAENMAMRSIRLKRHYLLNFAKVVQLSAATEDDLVAFLSKADWAAETRKSARSTLRGFYTWAHRRGLIDHNPAMYLRSVRVPNGRPRPVPEIAVKDAMCASDGEAHLMVLLRPRRPGPAPAPRRPHRARSGESRPCRRAGGRPRTRVPRWLSPQERPPRPPRPGRVQGWPANRA